MRDLIEARCGLRFDDSQRASVSTAIAARMQLLGLTREAEYVDRLRGEAPRFVEAELRNLLNLVTVTETCFFRDAAQFRLLRELIISAMEIAPGYPSGGRDERIMELILDELRVLPSLPLHLPEPREASLLALCRHIQATLAQPWTLEQAAERLNVSGRTLSRRFQRETGLRFGDWVRRARLLAALNALAIGRSVLEVALDLGYDSPSAFSAMFRRVLGVAPSDYFSRAVPTTDSARQR